MGNNGAVFYWLVLLSIVSTSWGNRGRVCFTDQGQEKYQNDRICCENRLEPIDPVQEKDCCPGTKKFYFGKSQICCGNGIHDRYIQDDDQNRIERSCCDKTVYNVKSHICCDDVLHDSTPGMECCGKKYINRTTHQCCRSEKDVSVAEDAIREDGVECCGHMVYSTSNEVCYRNVKGQLNVTSRGVRMCGDKKMGPGQICCLNVVQDMAAGGRCCGTTAYHQNNQTCCQLTDRVMPKSDHHQCCGEGFVDSRTHLCCGGKKQVKGSNTDRCCGAEVIDNTTHGCCDDQPYYSYTHKCCRGSGTPGRPIRRSETCCGGSVQGVGQLCCDGVEPVTRMNAKDNKCCGDRPENYKTYYDKEYDCVDGTVRTRLRGDGMNDKNCRLSGNGGNTRYDPREALCCNGRTHTFPAGQTLGCCLGYDLSETVFNMETQFCCNWEVHNQSSPLYKCCGDEAVLKKDLTICSRALRNTCTEESSDWICCGRHSFNKATDGDECCADQAYFKARSTCCGYKLYNASKGIMCCGSESFTNNTGTCCDGKLFYVPHGFCCGAQIYNPAVQDCNASKKIVYSKGNPNGIIVPVLAVVVVVVCVGLLVLAVVVLVLRARRRHVTSSSRKLDRVTRL